MNKPPDIKEPTYKLGAFNVRSIFETGRAAIEARVDHESLFATIEKFHKQLLERSEELILEGISDEALEVLYTKVKDEWERRHIFKIKGPK